MIRWRCLIEGEVFLLKRHLTLRLNGLDAGSNNCWQWIVNSCRWRVFKINKYSRRILFLASRWLIHQLIMGCYTFLFHRTASFLWHLRWYWCRYFFFHRLMMMLLRCRTKCNIATWILWFFLILLVLFVVLLLLMVIRGCYCGLIIIS